MNTRLRTLHRRWTTNDRGATTLEFVITAPIILLIIGVIIVGGIVTIAHQKVQHAATEAARSASLARTAAQAGPRAQTAATQDLAAKGLNCVTLNVSTNTSAFLTRPGVSARIQSTVTCTVSLDSLGLKGISGVRTITHTAESPLDTYRERNR